MFSTVGEGISQAHGKHSSARELVLVMNCTFRAQFIALTTKSRQANFIWQIKKKTKPKHFRKTLFALQYSRKKCFWISYIKLA